jgi:hypothetical protein
MKNNLNGTIVAAVAGLLAIAISNVAGAFPSRGGSCTSCHSDPGGSLTPSPNPLDIQLGKSGLLTFSVTSLGGSSNTAISVQGLQNPALNASIAPGGNTWTLRSGTGGSSYVSNNISSIGPYTLNLAIGSLATLGTYPIVVMYAGDGGLGTDSGFTLHIAPVTAAADFDEDGDVDGADLAKWRLGFGTASGATHGQGNADGDGDSDGADFLVWQQQRGSPPVVPAGQSVPEPATLAMVVIGRLVICRRVPYRSIGKVASWGSITRPLHCIPCRSAPTAS